MPDKHSTTPSARTAHPLPLPPEHLTTLGSRKRPRYSLRSLLYLMTAVAIGVVLARVYGAFFLGLLTATVFFGGAIVCVTAAVYCRGGRQAFFIGAACVACFDALNPPPATRSWSVLLVLVGGQVIALVVAGGIAVCTRRLIEKRGWNRSPHDLPDANDR